MDGEWHDWTTNGAHGARLSLPPIFEAEIVLEDGQWRAMVNGQRLSAYRTREEAKARCDWEVWNRVRCFRAGYLNLLARRASWENGAG